MKDESQLTLPGTSTLHELVSLVKKTQTPNIELQEANDVGIHKGLFLVRTKLSSLRE